ncbi:MAG: OFA family MFS transporter [Phycisphaerales bacterium]|nr:OFA family MFS transporter [Phycisphaerales bacterium]
MNRWLVAGGAILIQLALGAVYTWSLFTTRLEAGVETGGYGFTPVQTQGVFCAGLAAFALVMLYAGQLQVRIGPQKVAMLGGAVLGIGYILGGLLGKTFIMQLICIGIIGGAGIGLAYIVPIAVGVKWFPDKKGLMTGLSVAGFGFGATIWVKFGDSWIWDGGLMAQAEGLFGLSGVQAVYLIYGLCFLALVFLGSLVMVNPPDGWKPSGWNPGALAGNNSRNAQGADLMPAAMVRTAQYWGLLLIFTGSGMAGLMVIGCIKLFGQDSLLANGVFDDPAKAGQAAGTAMAFLAILNGLGRICWGTISDKLGRKTSLFLMCLGQGIIMLFFFRLGASKIGLIVGACIIGFNYGGIFALFPAATADFFGNKNLGRNYPFVFLAYGIAGIAGPQIAAYIRVQAGGHAQAWSTPFLIAGIACLVAAGLSLLLKPPRPAV